MMLAQQLYEGIELGDQGPVGLITYMRTDSYRVAQEALEAVRDHIVTAYGKEWVSPKPNEFKAKKGAQAAHEAIRPTDVSRTPEAMKPFLKRDQLRLYRLIWDRFVASQMAPARWAVTEINVMGGPYHLQARGRRLLFKGYLKVWGEEKASKKKDPVLPHVKEGEDLQTYRIDLDQHFTQPSPRYTEATLVKTLEKEGIGRPSTYAPIISTIQDRGYVKLRDRKFFASEIGKIVTDLLVGSFPKILEADFTSQLEDDLDRIEEGKADWTEILKTFYDLFAKDLDRAKREMPDLKKNPEPSGETCEKCGGQMMIRINKHGRFLGCENYPKCRSTVSLDEKGQVVRPQETEYQCNLCDRPLLLRTGRRGPFFGCSGYPECRNTLSVDAEGKPLVPEPTDEKCEKCESPMVVKRGRRGSFLACSAYPECRFTRALSGQQKSAPKETGEACEKCGSPMVIRHGRRGAFAACSGYPECKNTKSLDDAAKTDAKKDADA
jgi:DNA topoisomerase-1